jgi:alpha-tubulin suppressor-like RCC1 family protein
VWCWGVNRHALVGPSSAGEFDCGEENHCLIKPAQIPGLSDAVHVVGGAEFACALKKDGAVWCWGQPSGSSNTLGRDTSSLPACVATQQCVEPQPIDGVPAGTRFVQLSGSQATACARTEGGQVYCWGSNTWGLLGTQDPPWSVPPVLIPGVAGATDLALYYNQRSDHACVAIDGKAWCWGTGISGALGAPHGDASIGGQPPAPVDGVDGVVRVAVGEDFSCALRTDGAVWCWGANDQGQLGRGTIDTDAHPAPGPVTSLPEKVTSLVAGLAVVFARTESGKVFAWGNNDDGTLGTGARTGDKCTVGLCVATPTVIAGLQNASRFAIGFGHAIAIGADGAVWAWGLNDDAQLGHTPLHDPKCSETCNPLPTRVDGIP